MTEPPEGILVLVFTKCERPNTFILNNRVYHTDVELILVKSIPPPLPAVGFEGTDLKFDTSALLVYIDRMKGVTHCTNNAERFKSISSRRNNILFIPLTSAEFKHVIEFMYAVRGIRYNHWDYLASRTAALIPAGTLTDVVVSREHNVKESIKCLHPAQLTTLIIRYCVDPTCSVSAKLWGFNSRTITANELFEQLRTTCVALDADRLARCMLRALSEGSCKRP
jgi:hypothetical protein